MAYPRVAGYFKEHKILLQDVAKALGISRVTLYNKIYGMKNADFTATEIRFMCQEYQMNPEIFLSE